MERYKKILEETETVELEGYGKGLPIWRPYGMQIMKNIVNRFIDHLYDKIKFEFVEHPMLIPKEEYLDLFENIEFENLYTLDFNGRKYILKPDSLQFNFDYIFKHGIDAVLSIGTGYRYETGITPPLFRDRHIWPFVQFNHVIEAEEVEQTLLTHTNILSSLFEDLCLPHFFVDSGKKRNYGLHQINGMSFLDTDELTIISMSYVLSESFSHHFNTRKKLIDTGFTEKLLAMCALLNIDEKGLILPSLIAPYNVVCFDRNERPVSKDIIESTSQDNLRVYSDNSSRNIKRKFDIWEKKGVNILILTDGNSIEKVVRRYDKKAEPFTSVRRLSEILKENDEFLRTRNRRFMEKLNSENQEYYLQAFCKDCSLETTVFGEIFPHKTAICECGKIGLEYLVTYDKKIY